MKKNWILFVFFAAVSALGFSGCDDNDDFPENTHLVSQQVLDAFNQKYPQAKDVEWELKGNYAVVEFKTGNSKQEHSAWFNPSDASWYMTESDLLYTELPQPVKSAFEAGEYAVWKVDDVDMLTREGMETIYVLEVEQGKQEVDLYYSPEGVLVKAVLDGQPDDDYEGWLPQPDEQVYMDFVHENYSGARILEIEREDGLLEVSIWHGNKEKEVYFDSKHAWVKTTWDVRSTELPEAVKQAATIKYPEYQIDDADYVQTALGDWYELDLENVRTDHEIDNVKIHLDGTWF